MKPEKEFEELLRTMPPWKKRKPKPPEATTPKTVVVELASCNPYVPLERQRERISDAQTPADRGRKPKAQGMGSAEEARALANGTSGCA